MEHGKQEQKNQANGAGHCPHSGHGGIKHLLLMLVCCLAPLGLVLLLKQSGYDGAASYLILLLCPLMHLFMMRGMGHKQQDNSGEKQAS